MFNLDLYAAPIYFAKHPAPQEPEGLMVRHTLRLLGRNGEPMIERLQCDEQTWEGVPRGSATAISQGLLTKMAIPGVGITML